MNRILVAASTLLSAGLASAHEGHGPANPHWHASDLFGIALVAVVAGWLVWRGRQ